MIIFQPLDNYYNIKLTWRKGQAKVAKQMADQIFADLWNGSSTLEEAARKTGRTVSGAYGRMLEIKREKGWEMANLGAPRKQPLRESGKPASKTLANRPARQPVKSEQSDPDIAYAAAAFDMVGFLDVREHQSRQVRLMVRLTSIQKEVMERVHARFGGNLEIREGAPVVYVLTWASPTEIHDFLFYIRPFSQRWAADIEPILEWLGTFIELEWRTEQLLKIYQRTTSNEAVK